MAPTTGSKDKPTDPTALRLLNLFFLFNATSTPLSTSRVVRDEDLGYSSPKYESNVKQFNRDREALAKHGVIIREASPEGSSQREESLWELDRDRTCAQSGVLTADDVDIILSAMDANLELQSSSLGRWALHCAYLKLRDLAGEHAQNHNALEHTDAWVKKVQHIYDSFTAHRAARFTYKNLKGQVADRRVQVYGMLDRGENSYFVGYDIDAKGMRTFDVKSVLGSKKSPRTDSQYEIPADFDARSELFLPFDIGESGAATTTAEFRFSPDLSEQERDLITYGRGEFSTLDNGETAWRIEVKNMDAAAEYCLQHASSGMRPHAPQALIDAWNAKIDGACPGESE